MNDHQDKRRFPRVNSDLVLSISQYDNDDTQDMLSVQDMSLTGMFVATDQTFEMGSVLEITFKVPPDNHEIKANGIVMWCGVRDGVKGVGVELENLSLKDRYELYNHVMNRIIKNINEENQRGTSET